MLKFRNIVILFISINIFIAVGAVDNKINEIASKGKSLSVTQKPNTEKNIASAPVAPDDIGPEVALPESNQELKNPQVNNLDAEDLGSVKDYFYILSSISLLVICLIVFRTMRLRKTRAEIKYGQADKSETQPLPTSMSFDSEEENDDQTLFDINQLRHSRSNIHLV